MDDLLRSRAWDIEKANKKRRRKEKRELVSYSTNGKVIRGKIPVVGKVLIGFLAFVAALALFVYIPPFFYRDTKANSYVPIMPDATAIKTYQTYLKDHPEADFDQDGLDNSLEAEYGCDVWNVDTDGDGISDYAELFLTETSPTDASNILVKQVKARDDKNGETIGTAYKLNDIIFWPDDYQSKAYGAVVKLSQSEQMISYRFCYYSGWVRFPYDHAYAYGYKDGLHYELGYKDAMQAYKIDNSDEIRIYEQPLTFVHCLKLPFVDPIYLEDDGFGRFLTKILPNKGGFVNCHKAATVDVDPKVSHDVTSVIRSPLINRNDASRLGVNMNTLKDLSWVRKVIDAGHCVAVSLYSGNSGEAIGIIYGYTEEGNLLVANENLEPVGTIEVIEMAMQFMDKTGEIGFRNWYEWKGLGFDSRQYADRISFFASTLTEVEEDADIYTEVSSEEIMDDMDRDGNLESELLEVQTETEEVLSETEEAQESQKTVTVPLETQVAETEQAETAGDTVITFGF